MGVSKVIINGVTRVDLTQDTVAPEYLITDYTAHNRTGQAIVGTAVTDNDFTITLTKVNDVWTPDCTFAEAYAAYTAGKNIVFTTATDYVGVYGKYESTESAFYYLVTVGFDDFNGEYLYNWGVVYKGYIWTSNGIETADDSTYYTTELATASPSDVTQGKVFYNTEGVQVGTMSSVSAAEELNKVIFYDYDGTVLYTYTPQEFASLSALPPNPTHSRLTALGWNWTLADAKAEVATNKRLNIGQTYTTVSGATEIDVTIPATNLSPYLGCAISGSVVIDWGDNTATTTVTGSSTTTLIFTQHTYATSGDYTIKLTPSSTSSLYFRGTSTGYKGILSTTNALSSDGTYEFSITGFYEGNRTYLSNYALAGCPGLRAVTLTPGGTMGSYCFYTCRSLRHITLPGKNESNYSITTIDSYVFQYCMALQSVSIPKSVKTLSQSCFSNCYALESITLHEGLTNINITALSAVYALHRLDIPSTVTTLRSAGSSSSIKTISLPSSVTNANNLSFQDCSQLTTVVFPTHWPAGIPSFNNCVALTSITMPEQASGQCGVFSNCYALESIVIPEGITTLASNTFQNCYNLTSITLPSTLTAIPTYAFSANHRLETITIPASVTNIASDAFFNLRSIKAIHFLSETPPTLAASISDSLLFPGCILYVPYSADHSILNAYQTATNWSTVASRMQEE